MGKNPLSLYGGIVVSSKFHLLPSLGIGGIVNDKETNFIVLMP
jgi:hypothetical protein